MGLYMALNDSTFPINNFPGKQRFSLVTFQHSNQSLYQFLKRFPSRFPLILKPPDSKVPRLSLLRVSKHESALPFRTTEASFAMRFSGKPMTFRKMSCSRSTTLTKYRNHLWLLVFACFISWLLWLYLHYLVKLDAKNGIVLPVGDEDADDSDRIDSSVHVISNGSTSIAPATDYPTDVIETIESIGDTDQMSVPEKVVEAIEEEESVLLQALAKQTEQEPVDEVREVKPNSVHESSAGQNKKKSVGSDSCAGRYVYIHDLQAKFNDDMLRHCRSLSAWTDMCLYLSNMGLGPRLSNSERAFSNTGWFGTNQFSLEVIFHNRMKQYDCLTDNSSMASAIFVPFYAGLDVARYLWFHKRLKDTASTELSNWLSEQPEWKDMWGRNHFAVAGRISWDFRRQSNILSQWGNGLMYLPAFRNMTMLTIESSPWHRNDFGVPYPTYFHPSNDGEVHYWQNRMRRLRRQYLFSFAGGPRPNLPDSIRNQIISQCAASRKSCKLLECGLVGSTCHRPVNVMKMFQSSVFCLQPPGDSYTRRSVFDSILAGCIPVFFHPGSAYVQYIWHLPKNYTKYSVFIPGNTVRNGNVSIEKVLKRIPRNEVVGLREEVIRLIPKVIYANPNSRLETMEDAFDITVRSVLERVETVRRDMKEGRNSSFAFEEEMSWKYYLLGTDSTEHEWDPFFDKMHTNF